MKTVPMKFLDTNEVIGVRVDELEVVGQAEPTSRLLEGSSDQGAESEWVQDCLYHGAKGKLYYIFWPGDIDLEDKDMNWVDWDKAMKRVEMSTSDLYASVIDGKFDMTWEDVLAQVRAEPIFSNPEEVSITQITGISYTGNELLESTGVKNQL